MKHPFHEKIAAELDILTHLDHLPLPQYGSWPKATHQFDVNAINAVKTALAAQRPLLLRGDPGTGKSQLARAVATALGRLFVYEVVNAHTESQDLLWRFDAVGRLAEAQALQGSNYSEEERQKHLATQRYVSPGPLWWALCWETAYDTYQNSQYQLNLPEKPAKWCTKNGSVLLIDEIDKANAELPNGLLEVLGNNAIAVPWLKTSIGGRNDLPPLVIITTNEERELPAAFIRRCLVLNLALPTDDDEFIAVLVERGQLHYGDYCSQVVRQQAAEQLLKDRKLAQDRGVVTLPGQAEYLDILRALSVLGADEQGQIDLLNSIQSFALRKYPVMHAH